MADSANSGVVTQKQLEARTVYRAGELLEVTPGLIVSQHSGEGKANQFYLRGFNLDHGTDLRTTIDGMLYSLSGAWRSTTQRGSTAINAYVVRQRLDLYSNFTYFNDDPVNGDQFNQPDRRVTTGVKASHSWQTKVLGRESEITVGLQLESDNIFNGLHSTAARQRLSTTRQDHIVESSVGAYTTSTSTPLNYAHFG